MKKVLLLTSLTVIALSAQAQYSLSGSSPYVQNFDGIAGGLPTGWATYRGSSATSIGLIGDYSSAASYGLFNDTTCNVSDVVGGGFKNYPSASSATAGMACTAQPSVINRALGVRQVSPSNASHPNLDSGAAFVFEVANTGGITNLGCSFRLQSLDSSSPRVTTWRVQYAVGSTSTWTEVTPTGTMTTGGNTFSDNAITASFGTALDNKSSNVYIRIVTLDFSSGSGNRASTAIDSFKLTWTGSAGINDVAANVKMPVTVVSASTSDITLGFDVENAGNYVVNLFDMVGRKVATQSVSAVHGNQNVTLNGLNLAPGMYIAKVGNNESEGFTKVIVH